MKLNPRIRVFVKLDSNGNLTNTIKFTKHQPKVGKWIELAPNVCCTTTTTVEG